MRLHKPAMPRCKPSVGLINWFCKLLQDYMISLIFSCFILYGLYCAVPQVSQWADLWPLVGYTALFTLGWTLLLSNTLAMILSAAVFFIAGIAGGIFISLNGDALSRINAYFRWLASLFLASEIASDSYAKITALVLAVFCCFLASFLVSRSSGNLPILLMVLTVAAAFDLYGAVVPSVLLVLVLFALLWHYIRLRHSVYLDFRLPQTDTPSYGKMPSFLTFPAAVLVLLTVVIAFSLPEGLFLSNFSIRSAGKSVSSFFTKTEKDFFQSRKSVDYDSLPVGYENDMGPLFNQSDVITLKVTGYSENADYVYLRSHASSVYQNGWPDSQLSPIDATDPVSPFTMGQNELHLAQDLMRYRASVSKNPDCTEYLLLSLMRTSDINITYGDIKTSWVFELPMATSYSAFEGVSLQVADDLGGHGLFSSRTLPQNSSYTVTYLVPVKNEQTIDLYRYFGKDFYRSLSEDEIKEVYGERWEGYLLRAETIQNVFADPSTVPTALFTLGKRLVSASETTSDQALDIAETLVRSGAIDIIVIDSVAALVPQAEINGEMGDNHVGLQARLMSQALRKLTGILSKSNTCMLFINQLRMKIGVMFGNPETTTGGNALKFYATQRIDIRRIASIKEGEDVIGNRTRVKIVKNKVAAPFTQCEFDILYGAGISREASILDLAVELEIIQKSGAWFSYNSERIGQGRENTRVFLKNNPEIADEIEAQIRASMKDVHLFELGDGDSVSIDDDSFEAEADA